MRRPFTWPRVVFGGIAVLALAAYLVPQVTEGWYRDQLLKGLENGLGRKVEIGDTYLRLVPTPGFVVGDVIIGEDPSVGAEPAAYVKTLVARPGLLALFSGRFSVGSVTLDDASINLTRMDNGPQGVRWNFTQLVNRTDSGASHGDFPSIHMNGGRVNFKFGDTKSIFYLLETDVDLSPSAKPNGPLEIRVAGKPARSDRQARGFGSFVASGRWNPGDHSMELDVKLEKSELSDVLSLFEGGQSTLLGKIWGDAHLAGPMAKIGIAGRLNVSDLHGWNHSPPGGSAWPFNIGGTLDVPDQVIELQASVAAKQSPIGANLRVADYLGRPRWAATVSLDGVPVAPLTGMARNFGILLPEDLTLDGQAQGMIGYSTQPVAGGGQPGLDGQVRVSNGLLAAQGAPPLKIAQADVKFAGSTIELSPTSIVNDAGESADVEGFYDMSSGEMSASLTSSGMSIASLRRQVSVAGAPLIGLATAGVWSGSLHYVNKSEGAAAGWTGDIHLKDTDIPFEAFSQPIHLVEADAAIDDSGALMKHVSLTVGGIAATGEYRYETGAARPHRFRIVLAATRADDLEAMLTPTLRRTSFLTYAFNFGRVPAPDWLLNMHAEGSIQASSLVLAGTPVAGLRTNVVWDGTEVSLNGLAGKVSGAPFAGTATVHLAGRQPRYEINGTLSGYAWQGGTLTATGGLTTSGVGDDLLANLHIDGTFTGKRLVVSAVTPWDAVDGKFNFAITNSTPRLRLSGMTIQSAGAKWTGGAETQDGGQMVVKLADGSRHMEAAGALLRGEALKPVP